MTPRHLAREVALQLIYRYDVASPADAAGTSASIPGIASELRSHFDHFHVPAEVREFAAELVAGTLTERQNLDALIEKHAENWKVSRMGHIDRNILRLALYELKHLPSTPPSVVIDEAIELAKQFGTSESAGFVNGILDAALKRTLRATSPAN